jgi:hypothetical protein
MGSGDEADETVQA